MGSYAGCKVIYLPVISEENTAAVMSRADILYKKSFQLHEHLSDIPFEIPHLGNTRKSRCLS